MPSICIFAISQTSAPVGADTNKALPTILAVRFTSEIISVFAISGLRYSGSSSAKISLSFLYIVL